MRAVGYFREASKNAVRPAVRGESIAAQNRRFLDYCEAQGFEVATTFSEEEFLGQIESAGSRNGPPALRPLDAMTPRVWEVR